MPLDGIQESLARHIHGMSERLAEQHAPGRSTIYAQELLCAFAGAVADDLAVMVAPLFDRDAFLSACGYAVAGNVLVEQAAAIGREHGVNAGSYMFDGNTTEETYRTVLAGIDAGDPLIMDMRNPPNLSGEYGDDYSEEKLAAELDITECSECGHYPGALAGGGFACEHCLACGEMLSEVCEAYNQAASEGFWHEIERTARAHLG